MVDEALTKRWWWIRHAPTGITGKYTGRKDVPAHLPDSARSPQLPHDAQWFSSRALRARQSAAWLQTLMPLPCAALHTTDAFAEQDFGTWEGRGYDEVFTEHAGLDWHNPATLQPPNGESFEAVMKRVSATIDEIGTVAKSSDIIVVAHAGVIRAALAHALKLSGQQAVAIAVDHLALTRIDYHHGYGAVLGVNQPLWPLEVLI